MRRLLILVSAVCWLAPGTAFAADQFFSDEASFLSAVGTGHPVESFETLTATNQRVVTSVAAPDVTVAVPSATLGVYDTPTAGHHATDGFQFLSWVAQDGEGMDFLFAVPRTIFGVGITDAVEQGASPQSTLSIETNGGASLPDFLVGPLPGGSEAFIGVLADVPFTRVTITYDAGGAGADGLGVDAVHYGDPDPTCGDSVVGPGETCDLGLQNGEPEACCTSFCQLVSAGQVCRPGDGICDLTEVCDGASATCPSDLVEPPGTPCLTDGLCIANGTCQGDGGFYTDEATFLGEASGAALESFETLTATNTRDGDNVTAPLLSVDTGQPTMGVYDIPGAGHFATDGIRYVSVIASDGQGFEFSFPKPMRAFGVSITDSLENSGPPPGSSLSFSTDAGYSHPAFLTGPLPDGNERFAGVVSEDPFTRVTISYADGGAGPDGLAFDEVYLVEASCGAGCIPVPALSSGGRLLAAALLLAAGLAFATGRRRR